MTGATEPATRAESADMTALGSLPLLQGEDRADYKWLRAAVIEEMKPTDCMEMIWTNDIIHLEWEIIRFRRAKANYIRQVGGPDMLTVALGIAANIGILEPLERMIAMMEQRRNAAYYQAEEHRANLGNRLRQSVTQVEDTKFRELNDKPTGPKRAA